MKLCVFWCILKKKESNGKVLGSLGLVDSYFFFHLTSFGGIKLQTLWFLGVDLVLVCVLGRFWSHGLDRVSTSYSKTF